MPEDRSLDEFAVGADEEERGGAGEVRATDEEGGGADDADGNEERAIDADPATPTATWTTDGAACDRCGERVSRRWSDDGALVCTACKEW